MNSQVFSQTAYAPLGFAEPERVSTLRTVAHLFGAKKKRCGIYLLVFADDSLYLGRAVDVVRRFSQHRQNYNDIVGFAFQPTARLRLDEVERASIELAERLGYVLRNTMHVANVQAGSDLDGVVSPELQERWMAAPAEVNRSCPHERQALSPSHLARFQLRYQKFLDMSLSDWVVDMLAQYVHCAIPLPTLTEFSFWAISCLPGTNAAAYPRFCTLSVGVMEVFVLGYLPGHPNLPWGFLNVASDVLESEFGSMAAFEHAFPFVAAEWSGYRDAGQFQLRLSPKLNEAGIEPLENLLLHPGVQRAAAALVLRVMRKRATIYSKYHCKQLADAVLDGVNQGRCLDRD